MRDAYERFFEKFSITHDDFFQFGLDEIIHIPIETAVTEWANLKQQVLSNQPVTIRSYGRQGRGSQLFVNLIGEVLGNTNVAIDRTNNNAPTRALEIQSGHSKKGRKGCVHVRNYQVAHVFGRTKNPFAFTAPWNMVFIPKILDPFTGHEAKGEAPARFQKMFQRHVFNIFKPLIEDFNSIVSNTSLQSKIARHLDSVDLEEKERKDFEKAVGDVFSPVAVGDLE